MGLDTQKANLWVWVVLTFSNPIKALIEGRMKEGENGTKRYEELRGERRSV